MKSSKILITGKPGIGKTTIIRKVMDGLREKGIKFNGFYTGEVRERGERVGFKITGVNGFEGMLAHVNFKTNFRVGRYFVALDALEECANNVSKISCPGIIVIDEIGRMELFSGKFEEFVEKILNDDSVVVATVGEKFIERFMGNREVFRVTPDNRDSAAGVILDKLTEI